jgi:hypothetical protein
MSLTRYIKHKAMFNLKSWFKYHFPNPGLDVKKQLLVPSLSKSKNNGEIGTALDYLIRFNLERINKEVILKNKNWIAEKGYDSILLECDTSPHSQMYIGNPETATKLVIIEVFREIIINEFDKAVKNYIEFINNGIVTDELLISCVFLSKLDSRYRSSITDLYIDDTSSYDINELKQLINIVPWNNFKAKKHCFLNPDFGEGSKLVRGADADLIIDDILMDIKSSKEFNIKREDLSQLIGYYLLSHIGKINNEYELEINYIGIYFARYGYLWKYPLSAFYELEKYKELTEDFIKIINNPNLDLVKELPERKYNNLNLREDLFG